jgi:hypothetical protein
MTSQHSNGARKFSQREMQRLLRHAYTPPRRARRTRRGTGAGGGHREWTVSEMKLLGTVTDKEAARRLNRTFHSVNTMRRTLGIAARHTFDQPLVKGRPPGNRRRAFWLPEEDALLGTMSDEKLAKKLGRPVTTVTGRRMGKHVWLHKRLWRPEDDKLLGTRPDREVARLLGRLKVTVSARRRSLGIKCCYEHRPWPQHELAMLGVLSDIEVARLTGHPEGAVKSKRRQLGTPRANSKRRRWTKKEIGLLGRIPDQELAARLNCSVRQVSHKRRGLGLVSCFHRPWEDHELKWLESKSTAEAARLTGRTRIAVALKRSRLRRNKN